MVCANFSVVDNEVSMVTVNISNNKQVKKLKEVHKAKVTLHLTVGKVPPPPPINYYNIQKQNKQTNKQ